MHILMLDNYDSFTFNLVQMFRVHGCRVSVRRNDQIESRDIRKMVPDAVVISPGPGDPDRSGISVNLVAEYHRKLPILGVCLGLQCINAFFGGQTERTASPTHGKTSCIRHAGRGIFSGLPSPLRVARYHSLQARPGADSPLQVTAWTEEGMVMGLSHPAFPVHGVQFHPESFLTRSGHHLIDNFLTQCVWEGPWTMEGSQ